MAWLLWHFDGVVLRSTWATMLIVAVARGSAVAVASIGLQTLLAHLKGGVRVVGFAVNLMFATILWWMFIDLAVLNPLINEMVVLGTPIAGNFLVVYSDSLYAHAAIVSVICALFALLISNRINNLTLGWMLCVASIVAVWIPWGGVIGGKGL